MVDKVIVTLKEATTGLDADFELQANVRILDLKDSLCKALVKQYPDKFGYMESLEISYLGNALCDDETLASRGIWDGSVLELSLRR